VVAEVEVEVLWHDEGADSLSFSKRKHSEKRRRRRLSVDLQKLLENTDIGLVPDFPDPSSTEWVRAAAPRQWRGSC
jgi:hypothetical protein